ncbi:MAG: TonB-dependent receptor [Thermomonas sp.]|uniref:TonB-dependent receptor n=1 Tax=Thermomonas sp. TaxID=1971895 RepID=UPI001EC0470A|nr:TonB-dependent receptor [Thermomonas sp.]MBV2209821.1 TonB-dependent receptor [Thermomonas sp.]
MRKSMLTAALGLCLSSLVAAPALAQTATGGVAGRASAGDTVVVVNTATGLSRTATVNKDGTYRIGQLPPGNYKLTAGAAAPVAFTVDLGSTTTVNVRSDAGLTNLDAVQVIGSGVVNHVDVHSTGTATVIDRQELARLPVAQSMGSVALLAPGVIKGNSSFGGISFGGSSVAENQIYINGLNVTDFYRRQGNSSAPFAFFDQFQVKTGGYSVEFGRSTGGVINASVRSGGNEFHGGAELTFEPAAFNAKTDDHVFTHPTAPTTYVRGSHDRSSLTKTNVWASGPILKDRLFFFAMFENQDFSSGNTDNTGSDWSEVESSNGFWGTRLDWNLTDNHALSFMAFSDKGDSTASAYAYDWDSAAKGSYGGDTLNDFGGKNWTLTYTGHFGENFVAKAMYGENDRNAYTHSLLDDACNSISVDASYAGAAALVGKTVGCHPTGSSVTKMNNTRKIGRMDFEWSLGNHLLRFGLDQEKLTTDQSLFYPGPGGDALLAMTLNAGVEIVDGSGVFLSQNTDVIRKRHKVSGGSFETVNNAYYLEDNWNITDSFLLNLGVRIDSFQNRTASGGAFIDIKNLVAPRGGFSWDMKGDGTTKLYGNLGRYYLPVTNIISTSFAGGMVDEYSFYNLLGWEQATNPETGATYLTPKVGTQIGPTDTSMNTGGDDLRGIFPKDLKAVFQDEAILGYERAIDEAWSWGVNATYRRMTRTIEDTRITTAANCPSGFNWPIINPGEKNTLWCDDTGNGQGGWVELDTSVDGYKKTNGEIIGYKRPKREYKAVEFQIDRAWDGKWAFNASYLWSKSTGNFEGPVNSDTGYNDTGMVQYYDHPAVNERYGVLFNDHRHQVKLRGSYKLNDMWSFGSTLTVLSGGPITAYGTYWPGDNRAAGSSGEFSGGGSGWICVSNCTAPYAQRTYQYSELGAFGRMPWTYDLGASVTWTLPVPDVDLKVRFSVFNLLNQQTEVRVRTRYEVTPGVYRETFGEGSNWTAPRSAQLVLTYNF